MPSNAPRLSVVLPCYNAAATIAASLSTLLTYLECNRDDVGEYEVVVVDDGSIDGTSDSVRAFSEVRLVRHERNRGKGAAVRTGMLSATGQYRIFTDADLPFALSGIRTMLRYLAVKEFHLCIGSRARGSEVYQVKRPLRRRAASRLFAEFVGRIVVTGVRDTQCGFKGFRADAAEFLFGQSRVDGFAFDVEILYLAFKNDFDVKRIPVRLVNEDVSTVSVTRHGFRMLLAVLSLPLAFRAGRYRMLDAVDSELDGVTVAPSNAAQVQKRAVST